MALSRATSLQGLQVLNFEPSMVISYLLLSLLCLLVSRSKRILEFWLGTTRSRSLVLNRCAYWFLGISTFPSFWNDRIAFSGIEWV